MSTNPLVPVVNAGEMYVNNLLYSYTSTTTITVQAGAARDSTNTNDIILPTDTVLNTALVGLINGVDLGPITASSIYYLYVVADSTQYNPTGVLMSLNASAPLLPYGYDMYRYIGPLRINSSSQFDIFTTFGSGTNRKFMYNTFIQILLAGHAASFTAIPLTGIVPPIQTILQLRSALTPNAAGDTAYFRWTGSNSVSGQAQMSGSVAAVAQINQIFVPAKVATGNCSFDYSLDSASDALTLDVVGFDFYL